MVRHQMCLLFVFACSAPTRSTPTPTPASAKPAPDPQQTAGAPSEICKTLAAIVLHAPTKFAKLAGAPQGDHARASTVVLPGARQCQVVLAPGDYPTLTCTYVIDSKDDAITAYYPLADPIDACITGWPGWTVDPKGPIERRYGNGKQPQTVITVYGDHGEPEEQIEIAVQFEDL